jgi:hypothetical protein
MAGARLEDLYRRLWLGGRRIDMNIEEGDDQVGIMRVNLLV